MQKLDLVSLRFYKEAIINLCNKYHASNVQVFGSVARNEAIEKSDIDLWDSDQKQEMFSYILRLFSVNYRFN